MHTVLDLCTDAASKKIGITSRFLYAEPNDIMEIVEASTGIEPAYTDLQRLGKIIFIIFSAIYQKGVCVCTELCTISQCCEVLAKRTKARQITHKSRGKS